MRHAEPTRGPELGHRIDEDALSLVEMGDPGTMGLFERYAVLLKLVRAMNRSGSWTGETHVQESAFFLQGELDARLGYRFILYKHGPFSFQLRGDLVGMRAEEFLAVRVRCPGYGPWYVPGKRAALLEAAVTRGPDLERPIEFVARRIAPRSVAELEVLATAPYVSAEVERVLRAWHVPAGTRGRMAAKANLSELDGRPLLPAGAPRRRGGTGLGSVR